jgi:choice-of-anchor A domain-containing protein/LPXTG-motif cell wall-anchored protein
VNNPFIDLERVEEEILQLSGKFSGLTNLYTVNITVDSKRSDSTQPIQSTALHLTNPSSVGVINLTIDKLLELRGNDRTIELKGFQKGKNGAIVINVDCQGLTHNYNGEKLLEMPKAPIYVDGEKQSTAEVTEFSAGKVIWNFENASGVIIDTYEMTGIVIAPGATINIRSNLNGTIVAENINVYAESHRTDFTGTVVEPDSEKKPHQITIQKHETGYIANTLPGAEFKLYEYDNTTNAWVQIDDDAKQSTKVLVTDANGVIQLGGLKASVAYKLEEIKAPSGYIKSDTPFYFWIKAASADTKPSEPTNFSGSMISPGNTLFVPNTQSDTLLLKKIWKLSDGTDLPADSIPVSSITVDIYQLVNGNKSDTVYQRVILSKDNNWSAALDNLPLKGKDANGKVVTYTYIAEENFTLDGYTVTYEKNSTTITITNTKVDIGDYELPETGGSGTQVYILTGMMLILASIVLLYNQSRHRRGNV